MRKFTYIVLNLQMKQLWVVVITQCFNNRWQSLETVAQSLPQCTVVEILMQGFNIFSLVQNSTYVTVNVIILLLNFKLFISTVGNIKCLKRRNNH